MKINKIDFVKNYTKYFNKKSILETQKTPSFFTKNAHCFVEERNCSAIYKLPDYYHGKKLLYIESLKSLYLQNGFGSNCLKNIVRKSLKNPNIEGRIALASASVDHQTNPFGFYYKLGFRSTNEKFNELGDEWLKSGGNKDDAPWVDWSFMYLPKENIQQCLNYKPSKNSLVNYFYYKPQK